MAKKWIQAAFKRAKAKGTTGRCTGKKFGSASCPPGSKAYNMAKTLRKLNKKQAGGVVDEPKTKTYWSGVDKFKPITSRTAQLEFKRLGIPFGLDDTAFADTLKTMYSQHFQPYQQLEGKYFKNFGMAEEFDSLTRKRTGRRQRYNDPKTGAGNRQLPEYGWGGFTSGATGGASAGFTIGGPLGAIIGGVGGGLFGHLGEEQQQKRHEEMLATMQPQEEKEDVQPDIYTNPYASTITMCRGGRVRGRGKRRYAMGGYVAGAEPNVMLDNGEFTYSPRDNTGKSWYGPAGNDTIPAPVEEGTYVFSKDLIDPVTKKPFADIARKYEAKGAFETPVVQATKARNMENLFNRQESMNKGKQTKGKELPGLWAGGTSPRWEARQERRATRWAQRQKNLGESGGTGFGWGDALTLGITALPALYNIGQGIFGERKSVPYEDYRNPEYELSKGMYEQGISTLREGKPRYDISGIEAASRAHMANVPKLGAASTGAVHARLMQGAMGTQRAVGEYGIGHAGLTRQHYETLGQARMGYGQFAGMLGAQDAASKVAAERDKLMAEAAGRGYTGAGIAGISSAYQHWLRGKKQEEMKEKQLEWYNKAYGQYAPWPKG